jgi:hypothetical protein
VPELHGSVGVSDRGRHLHRAVFAAAGVPRRRLLPAAFAEPVEETHARHGQDREVVALHDALPHGTMLARPCTTTDLQRAIVVRRSPVLWATRDQLGLTGRRVDRPVSPVTPARGADHDPATFRTRVVVARATSMEQPVQRSTNHTRWIPGAPDRHIYAHGTWLPAYLRLVIVGGRIVGLGATPSRRGALP